MNLYKIQISKGKNLGTYEYYVVAESFSKAEKVKRPKDWSPGTMMWIERIDEPVLVQNMDQD